MAVHYYARPELDMARAELRQYLDTARSIAPTFEQGTYTRAMDGALVTKYLPTIVVTELPPLYVQMSAAYTTEEV